MKSTLENRIMHKWRATVAVLALALAAPLAALAQNMIQSITSSQQAGTEVVRIELSEPLAAVPGGLLDPGAAAHRHRPARRGQWPGQELGRAEPGQPALGQRGAVRRPHAPGAEPASQAANYRVAAAGQVADRAARRRPAPVAAASAARRRQFAPAQNDQPLPLRDIDFRRGGDGAGRVIVDLPSTQVGVDIRQQGQNLVVEFLRSTLPDKLRRRLDVTDFGTPVQTVSTFQSGDRVRMVVEPKGSWEHSAYQTDNQFVLEVRPMKVDPNKLMQGPGFAGEKLSAELPEHRSARAAAGDRRLHQLQRRHQRHRHRHRHAAAEGRALGPGAGHHPAEQGPGRAQERQRAVDRAEGRTGQPEQVELESRKKIAELEPVRTQAFQLNYTKAETIAKSLVGSALVAQAVDNATGQNTARILSPRGSVIFEQRTNQLFVTDIPSKLEEVQAMIAKIDIPVRQVLIEARIVEADDNFGQSLGVKLGFADLSGAPTSGAGRQPVRGRQLRRGRLRRPARARRWTSATPQFVNLPANTGSLGAATRPPLRCRCSAPRPTRS